MPRGLMECPRRPPRVQQMSLYVGDNTRGPNHANAIPFPTPGRTRSASRLRNRRHPPLYRQNYTGSLPRNWRRFASRSHADSTTRAEVNRGFPLVSSNFMGCTPGENGETRVGRPRRMKTARDRAVAGSGRVGRPRHSTGQEILPQRGERAPATILFICEICVICGWISQWIELGRSFREAIHR